MGSPPAFQMYAADFLVDTADWTVDEIGIYLRLLLNEWVNGQLPNDDKRLSRIAGVSHQKFKKKFKTLEGKFKVNGSGFLYNRRLEEEREKQLIWREKSKLGGIKSGEMRRRVVEPPNEPNGQPNGNSSSSSSNIILSKDKMCPQSEIVDLFKETIPEAIKPKDWGPERQTLLRARWNEEEKRQNVEWWKNLFLYIRKCPFLMGEVDPALGHKRFFITLPWLVKKANLLKVIEGNYERIL